MAKAAKGGEGKARNRATFMGILVAPTTKILVPSAKGVPGVMKALAELGLKEGDEVVIVKSVKTLRCAKETKVALTAVATPVTA
jgi:hypothetical protein